MFTEVMRFSSGPAAVCCYCTDTDTSNLTPLISPTVATEDAKQKKSLVCPFRATVETWRCNMVDCGRGPALCADDYKVTKNNS